MRMINLVRRPAKLSAMGSPLAQRQSGATLIEVMIAVLILAVGLLGLMALQINGKKATFQALQRSAASHLAKDMLTRMRINPNTAADATLLAGEYDTAALASSGLGGSQIAAAPIPDCGVAGGCTPVELAAYDLYVWEQRLDNASTSSGLLNPTGCISVDEDFVQVVLTWESAVELDQTALLATMAVDCGAGKYGTDDKLRQAVIMSTYIAAR